MAFCNSCGTTLAAGARFCPKCGGAVPLAAAAAPVVVAPTPAAAPQSNSALKVILIVVGVVVVLGIIGVGTLAFVVRRIAHRSHIENRDGNVRVETPFGSVQTTDDPAQASRDLGIDLYPGARVLRGNTANIGGMHTVEAEFETGDSAEQVLVFYASKFSNPNVTTRDKNHYTIVSTDKKNLVTISIDPEDSKTRIKIASVSGKNLTGDNSPD